GTPDERFPVVVTTSKLLGTGVDVPTCKYIALARPIGSIVEFKQIIGRGTRLYEPDKVSFTILDYSGATRHFFDPEFDGDPEVVEVEALVRRPPMDPPEGDREPQPDEDHAARPTDDGASPIEPPAPMTTGPEP